MPGSKVFFNLKQSKARLFRLELNRSKETTQHIVLQIFTNYIINQQGFEMVFVDNFRNG